MMDNFPAECVRARTQGGTYPQLSKLHPQATLEDAYALQSAFITQLDLAPRGYKAALTAAPAQQAMGLDEPIVGMLLSDTAKDSASPIPVAPGGILETELGYVLAQDITAPVTPDNVIDVTE